MVNMRPDQNNRSRFDTLQNQRNVRINALKIKEFRNKYKRINWKLFFAGKQNMSTKTFDLNLFTWHKHFSSSSWQLTKNKICCNWVVFNKQKRKSSFCRQIFHSRNALFYHCKSLNCKLTVNLTLIEKLLIASQSIYAHVGNMFQPNYWLIIFLIDLNLYLIRFPSKTIRRRTNSLFK